MKRESPGGCTNPRTGLWPTVALAATGTEARSAPGLSAWLIIRACSQKGVPNTVRQETPEPHKQVRRRRDRVAAPGAAGGERMLYGLGDRLWSASQPGDETPLVV